MMEQIIPKHREALFQNTYIKALLDNKHNLSQWKDYKEKYEEVIKNLKYYAEKHQHSIFLPVGSKAYVRGKLVHTNDVWVTLGCGYFLKTSSKKAIEICERRIKSADELIEKWEKEKKLLESMREYSVGKDAFASEGSQEIIEKFDEDKEKEWQKEHREKERRYRQQLKEVKEKTTTASINTEKDIWEHLEALELQEELEDELNRLGCDIDTSSEDEDEEESSEEENEVNGIDKKKLIEEISDNSPEMGKKKQLIEEISDNSSEVRELKQSSLRRNPRNEVNKKTVSFKLPTENSEQEPTQPIKIRDTEVIQNAVSETVYENISKPLSIINDPKRPISKFKMNRK